MTDYIEKKAAEADSEVKDWFWKCCNIIFCVEGVEQEPPELEEILRRFLQEALLKGLEMAEGAVPEEDEYFFSEDAGTEREEDIGDQYETMGEAEAGGFNIARAETLSRLAALKKEVMEGME